MQSGIRCCQNCIRLASPEESEQGQTATCNACRNRSRHSHNWSSESEPGRRGGWFGLQPYGLVVCEKAWWQVGTAKWLKAMAGGLESLLWVLCQACARGATGG
jgi:hypothetical protein